MKMKVLLLIVALGFTVLAGIINKYQVDQETPQFNFILRGDKTNGLFDVNSFVKLDTLQKISDRSGLTFILCYQNSSSKDVIVRNPLDHTFISLENSDNNDVAYPFIPRHLIKLNNAKSYSYGSFTVDKIVANDLPLNDDDKGDQTLLIPRDGNVEIHLKITSVLKPNAAKPYQLNELVPLPVGRYQFSILSSLIIDNEDRQRNVLELKPVSVRCIK